MCQFDIVAAAIARDGLLCFRTVRGGYNARKFIDFVEKLVVSGGFVKIAGADVGALPCPQVCSCAGQFHRS